ncbi:unnamed protein product [Prunus armeniaca]|uniref:Uncharacterized protein n=1 Tax=Prunus armeniaca TaxID=36596 RepID=A0A6J5X7B4_PRUAR|nr:unnamed protein product [Prunus armeniaca]CAB4307772.1 unnamed protein product [Prunus armeniaca]
MLHSSWFLADLEIVTSVIEFARSVLSLERADSIEFDEHTPNPIVVFMPKGSRTHMGSTVRLGSRRTLFQTPDCITSKLKVDAGAIQTEEPPLP